MITKNIDITNFLKASYPFLWVETYEEDRAIKALSKQAKSYQFYEWDLINGVKLPNNEYTCINNPAEAIKYIQSLPNNSIFFLKDMQNFMGSANVVRQIKNCLPHCKANKKHFIAVSPISLIPTTLEKDIVILDFPLPDENDLISLAREMIEENHLPIEIDEKAIQAIKNAKGLTITEAENVIARCIITSRKLDREIIEEDKLQCIKKNGKMEVFPTMPITEVGGHKEYLKFILNRKRGFYDDNLPTPKSVCFVGPPGTGKTLLGKVTAGILEMPFVKMDVGGMKDSLVGSTGKNIRNAFKLIKSIAPCTVLLEEIEKAIGGAESSNKVDAGTTSDIVGVLLTEIEEMKEKVFFISTCNDIDSLLNISQGALMRRLAESLFFIDLPSSEERKEILGIMNKRYNTNIEYDNTLDKATENWTGFEVEKFVKDFIYDGKQAIPNIKPLYLQNKEKIDSARRWAKENARLSSIPVIKEEKGRKIEL